MGSESSQVCSWNHLHFVMVTTYLLTSWFSSQHFLYFTFHYQYFPPKHTVLSSFLEEWNACHRIQQKNDFSTMNLRQNISKIPFWSQIRIYYNYLAWPLYNTRKKTKCKIPTVSEILTIEKNENNDTLQINIMYQ